MRVAPLALLAVAIAPLASQAPATKPFRNKACGPVAAIDSTALLGDLFKLADDSTRGRGVGSKEADKVRAFLAARFQWAGLTTVGDFWVHNVPGRPGVKTANVVGVVKGTKFPDEYIVVTGHYDHLGVRRPAEGSTDSIMNGSDDNASGTAALAVLAKYFVKLKPAHSIVFAAVDAEESGMYGSKGFVEAPTVPLDQILLNVNLDMLSRNVDHEIYASGARKYPQLQPLVEATEACAPITLKLGHDDAANLRQDWTNQSDQGSFHKKGIPFIYFGVEDHPDYHKVTDSPDKAMPGFFVGTVQTAADFIRRFDAKPVPRAPKTAIPH